MSKKVISVRNWIEDLPKRGRITFSMVEVESRFSNMPKRAVRSSIYRLIEKGRVYSAWRGFYVIVPDEHALMGFVPPIEYIESLMAFTGHKYYVGLLSAAAIYGAGHQQPQILTVVTDSNNIRSKKSSPILFLANASLPEAYLIEQNAGFGKVLLSSPELTALDLICYENRIGGLNRAVDIISELNLDFKKSGDDLWRMYKTPIIQRLGFILENVLGLDEISTDVYSQAQAAGIRFRKTLLDPKSKPSGGELQENSKWKIIENCKLEIEA
ncbi:MAG: type IV toxin-antitoxin system AbiEi family antitoxin [Oscillospiraceae bacterium]|nr:type IV toxin-antitoxin system AbiEi family antitoxin [Oscillospiraceae bacterium]